MCWKKLLIIPPACNVNKYRHSAVFDLEEFVAFGVRGTFSTSLTGFLAYLRCRLYNDPEHLHANLWFVEARSQDAKFLKVYETHDRDKAALFLALLQKELREQTCSDSCTINCGILACEVDRMTSPSPLSNSVVCKALETSGSPGEDPTNAV